MFSSQARRVMYNISGVSTTNGFSPPVGQRCPHPGHLCACSYSRSLRHGSELRGSRSGGKDRHRLQPSGESNLRGHLRGHLRGSAAPRLPAERLGEELAFPPNGKAAGGSGNRGVHRGVLRPKAKEGRQRRAAPTTHGRCNESTPRSDGGGLLSFAQTRHGCSASQRAAADPRPLPLRDKPYRAPRAAENYSRACAQNLGDTHPQGV